MLSDVVLGLDPSSTRTGYCLLNLDGTIRDAGYLSGGKKDAAIVRIAMMVEDLEHVLADYRPRESVVEIPSGKAHSGQRRGAGASLTVYGVAAGAIWQATRGFYVRDFLSTDLVRTVDERTWTRCVPKAVRNRRLAAQFPAYREQLLAGKDSGGDVGDAIGLALFGLAEHRLRERAKGVA